MLDARERPCLANGCATLGNDAGQPDVAADGNSHAALLEYVAVQINLGGLIGENPAGQAAERRERRVSFVPGTEPAFRVEMKRINEHKPAIGAFRFDTGFQMPVGP